jgi:hypothetical protein
MPLPAIEVKLPGDAAASEAIEVVAIPSGEPGLAVAAASGAPAAGSDDDPAV